MRLARTTHLIAIPYEDTLALMGTKLESGYRRYQWRITGRRLPVFVLDGPPA